MQLLHPIFYVFMGCKAGTFEQHSHLGGTDRLGSRLVLKYPGDSKPTTIKATSDDKQPATVARKRPELSAIPLYKDHTVATVRVKAKPVVGTVLTMKTCPCMLDAR